MGRDLPPDMPVAVLEVADTGPGMERADAERVFERLFRTERSRDRRHGGAGLGLAIVAAIVQAHGGRVELTTAPGAGSRFRVLLPAEATDPERRTLGRANVPMPTPAPTTVDSQLAPSDP